MKSFLGRRDNTARDSGVIEFGFTHAVVSNCDDTDSNTSWMILTPFMKSFIVLFL